MDSNDHEANGCDTNVTLTHIERAVVLYWITLVVKASSLLRYTPEMASEEWLGELLHLSVTLLHLYDRVRYK